MLTRILIWLRRLLKLDLEPERPDSSHAVRDFLVEIGRKGGQSRSPRKVRAARRNAVKARKGRAALRKQHHRELTLKTIQMRERNKDKNKLQPDGSSPGCAPLPKRISDASDSS